MAIAEEALKIRQGSEEQNIHEKTLLTELLLQKEYQPLVIHYLFKSPTFVATFQKRYTQKDCFFVEDCFSAEKKRICVAEQPEEITEDLLNTYKEQANEIKLGGAVEQLKKLTEAYLEKANANVHPIVVKLGEILNTNDVLHSQRISDFYKHLDQIGTGNKTNLQRIKEDKSSLFNGKSLMGLFNMSNSKMREIYAVKFLNRMPLTYTAGRVLAVLLTPPLLWQCENQALNFY